MTIEDPDGLCVCDNPWPITHPDHPLVDDASAAVLEEAVVELTLLRAPMALGDGLADLHAMASLLAQLHDWMPLSIGTARSQDHTWEEIANSMSPRAPPDVATAPTAQSRHPRISTHREGARALGANDRRTQVTPTCTPEPGCRRTPPLNAHRTDACLWRLLALLKMCVMNPARSMRGGPGRGPPAWRSTGPSGAPCAGRDADHRGAAGQQEAIWQLPTETLWGYEALVRWQHPEQGLLAPSAFLGVVDDAGRDGDLGEVVLRAACRRGVTLSPADTVMSVNISAGQIASDAFPDLVGAVLADCGLSASRLCLEISERSILDRPAQGPATPIRHNLERLSALGVHLAIDDFGTGYSSLTHVLQFPVSMLKIDQSFVQGMTTDRQSHSVVAALIELARGMGLGAVAEGIEQTDQLNALKELGCPFGQGYLLGRPAAEPTNAKAATLSP